jgi:glutathione synthase/RimK-type ligase-like ATP-grasp enzyme
VRSRHRIALASSRTLPPDELLLAAALDDRGMEAEEARWDDQRIDWHEFDAVVIRTCWDYHRRLPQFLDWVDSLTAAGIRLLNPAPLVHWNHSKHYLFELAEAGARIPRTVVVAKESDLATIAQRIAPLGIAGKVVIKPAVSASAESTSLAELGNTLSVLDSIWQLSMRGDVIIQEFVDLVQTSGETSLVFIAGAYSHAVRKVARQGDFRVQSEHGGQVFPARPTAAVISQAADILRNAPSMPAYARIDGIDDSRGKFILMELELVEPELFFEFGDAAAMLARFIAAEVASPRTRQP